jgi:SAM-dependent methyltransferase
MRQPFLQSNTNEYSHEVSSSRLIDLNECISSEVLISPDTLEPLRIVSAGELLSLSDGSNSYRLTDGCPILYPLRVQQYWEKGLLPFEYYSDPLLQYCLLSQIKQRGEINAHFTSTSYKRFLWRCREFTRELKGTVLDIGCDNPILSSSLFPPACSYIGIDPYATCSEEQGFRVIGIAEILPFRTAVFDNVAFFGSMDHILDFHTAIRESWRVLANNGMIVISTYAWLSRATLLTDSVHFHHFRESEIIIAVTDLFRIEDIIRYEDPKDDSHRYQLMIKARKRIAT